MRGRPARFSGASDEAISRTIDNALGLPLGTPAVIRDPEDGSALAVSDSLPDGLILDATPATSFASNYAAPKWDQTGGEDSRPQRGLETSQQRSSDDGFHGENENDKNGGAATANGGREGGGGGGSSGGSSSNRAKEFRGELLKFERVNAHLANERTWLAWVRTALSVLGVALSLLSLMDDMDSTGMDSIALALGVAFVVCTLFTYMTGWLRYTRVTKVLTWTGSQVKGTFGRFRLQYFTRFLGIALVLTVPVYLYGGVNVVKDA